jgi:hypothetical protein
MTDIKQIHHYYVDEAGDLTFFDKRGSLMLGKEGVSNNFMLGLLQLENPELAKEKLEFLRQELLSDPEFRKIPSVIKKTALMFHAKNDHPKVREKVFEILPSLGAKVQIAIKDKVYLANEYKQNYKNEGTKMSDSNIYDDLVIQVFKNMLHQADENRIIFARLGTSERREALATAIRTAKSRFRKKSHDKPTVIDVKKSSDEIGLQIIDYYLWAVQRLYEKGEDCYFMRLQNDYSLIIDLDDKRKKQHGAWYTRKNPLTLEKIRPLVS